MYDQFNTKITEGSFITYPRRLRSDMWMQVAKVMEVDEERQRLRVVADTGHELVKSTLRKPSHTTVVHPCQLEAAGYMLEDFDIYSNVE